jgi:signal transduction histidine kinase
LRTPLTSIKGSLDLINSGQIGPVHPQVRPLLDMASKNSRRLAHLIDDLLDLQKIEAGEMSFKLARVDVAATAGRGDPVPPGPCREVQRHVPNATSPEARRFS